MEMAQCVKCLLSKYEVLSLDPQHTELPGTAAHTSAWRSETDRSQGGFPGQLVYPQQQLPG